MKRQIFAVRLTPEERRLVEETRVRLGVSQSEVVREAIVRYAAQTKHEAKGTAEERLAPWIGMHDGGSPELSTKTGARYRKLLEQKHGRRPR